MSNKTKKGMRTGPDRTALRAAVAEAVHQTVCDETGSDGFGHCMLYAIVGAFTARHVFGHDYLPQAGSLLLQHDPADPDCWVTFDARGNGIVSGEFHAWFGRVAPKSTGMALPLEIADLCSRHYPKLVELPPILHRETQIRGDLAATVVVPSGVCHSWKRPEPCPPYVWTDGCRQLDWVNLVSDEAACQFLWEKLRDKLDSYKRLVAEACNRYRQATA
jgi:hypothetical protein